MQGRFSGLRSVFSESWSRGEFKIERSQRINDQIRTTPVRVIAADGSQLGVMPTEDAINQAVESGLDLVEVAPNGEPPVCRIMDFGKFKYQQKKRSQRGHAHHSKIKEIRVRPKIGQHDIDVKVNRAKQFLEHKDKVIISVIFRGRELAHVDEGRRVVDGIIEQLAEISKVETPPMKQGRRIVAILSPK